MNKEIEKYTKLGVNPDKIIFTEAPSVVIYSLTRKCLVGGKNSEPTLELIKESDGNFRLSYENNRILSLQINKTIRPDLINNSSGIIITDKLYEHTNMFRFAYIPNH